MINRAHYRSWIVFLCVSVPLSLALYVLVYPVNVVTKPFDLWRKPINDHGHDGDTTLGLGIFTDIFVVSLRRRSDRRDEMEVLRNALDTNWRYVDATDTADVGIQNILDRVRMERVKTTSQSDVSPNSSLTDSGSSFQWPRDVETLSRSGKPIGLSGSDLWPETSFGSNSTSADVPLTCAIHDDEIPVYSAELPDYMILSAPKVACWHSHLAVIRAIVSSPNVRGEAVSLVLEDDIDMERDIQMRLASVWPLLPRDWDILFLGHCWSNESTRQPLTAHDSNGTKPIEEAEGIHLHPSFAPKCTHAYALSAVGARKLYLHLVYPRFAYSRAIDQAYSWLVVSGRINSYSIVPSIVVQRKIGVSDVSKSRGSSWRDTLHAGVFATRPSELQ